ncbi:MAG TPA: heme ABC transporter ATP-binding protein [Cyclobacteriaceae bacterium]|nr:heme ABC transporter ATP-binding protein [Cyclobacteriaceae bacterium]
MYEANDLSLRIGSKVILDDVSIKLHPGKFTAVVGPNGAGKSSLLKIIAGEQTPSQGAVKVNGKNLRTYRSTELSMLRAVLPQQQVVQFAFSVEQVIHLGRHVHRSRRSHDERIVAEVMRLTDVYKFRHRSYPTLSGGEKQRVQLARVLAQVWDDAVHPRYVLMDEPTASLDIAQQQHIFALARQVCGRNIGVMAIVHDLNQAARFADELYFIGDGRLVASGSAREVFTRAVIQKTFRCNVNVYHDPCSGCPFIIPETFPSVNNQSILKPVIQ